MRVLPRNNNDWLRVLFVAAETTLLSVLPLQWIHFSAGGARPHLRGSLTNHWILIFALDALPSVTEMFLAAALLLSLMYPFLRRSEPALSWIAFVTLALVWPFILIVYGLIFQGAILASFLVVASMKNKQH